MHVALPRRAGRIGTAALLLATPLSFALPIAAAVDTLGGLWRHGAVTRSTVVWVVLGMAWTCFALLTSFALHGPRRDLRVRVWATTPVVMVSLGLLVFAALAAPLAGHSLRHSTGSDPLVALGLLFFAPATLLAAPLLVWVVGRATSVYETGSIPELEALLRALARLLLGAAVVSFVASPALAAPIASALGLALLASTSARELERRRRSVLAAAQSGALRRIPRHEAFLGQTPPRVGHEPNHALVAASSAGYRDRPVALYLVD